MTGNRTKRNIAYSHCTCPIICFLVRKLFSFTCNKLITALLSLPDLRNGPDLQSPNTYFCWFRCSLLVSHWKLSSNRWLTKQNNLKPLKFQMDSALMGGNRGKHVWMSCVCSHSQHGVSMYKWALTVVAILKHYISLGLQFMALKGEINPFKLIIYFKILKTAWLILPLLSTVCLLEKNWSITRLQKTTHTHHICYYHADSCLCS